MVRLASNHRSARTAHPEYAIYSDRNCNQNDYHSYTFVRVRGNEQAIVAFNKLLKRPYGPGTRNVSGWFFQFVGHYDAAFCRQLQTLHSQDNFFESEYINKKMYVPTAEQFKRICANDEYWGRTENIFKLLTNPNKLEEVNELLKEGEVINDAFWEEDVENELGQDQ